MRRDGRLTVILLLCGLLLLIMPVVAGCGGDTEDGQKPDEAEVPAEPAQPSEEEETESESADESISVQKGLFDVEITLPASMFEDADMDEAINDAEEDGVTKVVVNDDGSVTYYMPRSVHNDMMSEMRQDLLKSIDEMKTSDDYVSIRDVRHNNNFSEFTMVVDEVAFRDSFDGFAAFGLGFLGTMYQSFDGVKPNDIRVAVHFENEDTGEIFDTVAYPDAFEE